MPRARRGRNLLMGGSRRKRRGVSRKRKGRGILSDITGALGFGRRRRTRGRGVAGAYLSMGRDLMNLARSPAGIAMMKASGRRRRRVRGGSAFSQSIARREAAARAAAAPAAVQKAVAQVAKAVPAKSGSKVKTALKTLAGLAGLAGATYLGSQVVGRDLRTLGHPALDTFHYVPSSRSKYSSV
jgi:hypothetical protein